jgi:hypothetical protein
MTIMIMMMLMAMIAMMIMMMAGAANENAYLYEGRAVSWREYLVASGI